MVAVGGGHGLAVTLRALRLLPVAPTAVVSVADDGGSTGRLRAEGNCVAPGDLRKCLSALASDSSELASLLEHRFESGELKGHAFGNLVLMALEEREGGLLAALDEASRMLGCVGTVLPATTEVVDLVAQLADGTEIVGQSRISATRGVRGVSLRPRPEVCDRAVRAIRSAGTVVLGPGSLYTSVLAAAAVPGVAEAVTSSPGRVVYVCNLRPQLHETEGYEVADHVDALRRHGIEPDVVLVDVDGPGPVGDVAGAVVAPVRAPGALVHDPGLLARALGELMG